MTSQYEESVPDPAEAFLEPNDAEIAEWAAQERKRREAWLCGPTRAQKSAWARRERERRMLERGGGHGGGSVRGSSRVVQRYVRGMQLAAEGAMSLLFNASPSQVFDNLVKAGREWEEEFTSQLPRRRRVKLDASAAEEGSSIRSSILREEASRPN